MNESIEIRLLNYQIEKITTRILYQKNVIRRLGFNKDPGFAEIANGTIASLEKRLAELLAYHSSLPESKKAP